MTTKRVLLSLVIFAFSFGLFAPALLAGDDDYRKHDDGAAPLHLVKSFEDLLHRQESLLNSFQSLVNLYHVPPIELLKSYEDLLRRQALLLDSFEEVARPYACGDMHPELKVIKSFEMLLHGQAALLATFEDLIHKLKKAPVFLIESFEDLLRRQAGLVKSFEGMLHCLADKHRISPRELYPFLTSFEHLIRSQAKLLVSFGSLVKGTRGEHDREMDKRDDERERGDYDKPEMEMPKHDDDMGYGGKNKDDDDEDEEYKPDYEHDKPYDHDHEGYEKPEFKGHGYGLPDLDAIVEFAKHGMYLVKYNHLRDLFEQRAALTERFVAMILDYKLKMAALKEQGKHEEVHYAMMQFDQFRLDLSQLQGKLVKKSIEVMLAPKGDEYEHDSDYYAYHKLDDSMKLIISNNGPFTINMATLAVFDGYKMVASMSLGTLEPGEHRVIKLRELDPYMIKLIEKSAVVTGFIGMFSKFFQAAMMD